MTSEQDLPSKEEIWEARSIWENRGVIWDPEAAEIISAADVLLNASEVREAALREQGNAMAAELLEWVEKFGTEESKVRARDAYARIVAS